MFEYNQGLCNGVIMEYKKEGLLLGFIGQGYVGKNYADEFESRGFSVVRFSQEEPYLHNKEKIREADIVFIAVPTPTKPEGFDSSIVREVLALVGKGKIAVIKSTLLPGTTEALAQEFPDIFIVHSPEFLSESTASADVKMPRRNIIGIPEQSDVYKEIAQYLLSLFPSAPYTLVCGAREAELIKYANNTFFYTKVVFMNILYDLAMAHGCAWEDIRNAMANEPWIGSMHIDPVHKTGRGGGGPCYIKDFAAFRSQYEELNKDDALGVGLLRAIEEKNLDLLSQSNKNIDIVEQVYGPHRLPKA